MKKRICAIILAFSMLVGMLTISAGAAGTSASGTCGDNLTWTLENGVLTISGTGNMDDYGSMYDDEASDGEAYSWLNLPWSDQTEGLDGITTIIIEEGVTSIGDSAFCLAYNVTSVSLPSTLTSIGDCAFDQCFALTEIIIPDSVTYIGDWAFEWCESLESLSISENCELGEAVFSGCYGLADEDHFVIVNNILFGYDMDYLDWGADEEPVIDKIVIPDGVTRIDYGVFWDCPVKSVTIQDSVTVIGAYAFMNCTYLTSVTIPENVTYIGDSAFDLCESLKTVYFTGSAPTFDYTSYYDEYEGITYIYTFDSVTATVYYPADKDGWSSDIMLDYGGDLTWVGYVGGFYDVSASQYYADPMVWAVENGITTGMSDTSFAPLNTCTRAQAVTFLYRMAGEPAVEGVENPFTDVSESDYYYEAVLWAVENGITTGTTDTTFTPDQTCSRSQIVTFLYRYCGETVDSTNPFTDVNEGEYYYEAVLWAVENGVTTGMTDTTFSPGGDCLRGQIVTFLYRARDLA